MVARRGDAVFPQQGAGLLHRLAGVAVDDARTVFAGAHKGQQRFFFVLGMFDRKEKVLAVKPGRFAVGVLKFQVADDVRFDAGRCRSGKGAHRRTVGELFEKIGDF